MRGVDREPVEPATPWLHRVTNLIAWGAVAGIAVHLVLRFLAEPAVARIPLLVVLAAGGTPLVVHLAAELWRRNFGSDLLAGISIVTSVLLGEYLAGTLVVLMLSGGEALERYAVGRASSVLRALARRMPSVAHRRADGRMVDVALDDVDVGDVLVVLPHEICPVDGEVVEGHGVMDESYLTGEPYEMSKAPGSQVLSGSINGESALTIRATHRAVDSRYAKIMEVMRESEQRRPRIRRLADRLGAWYTPLAVGLAVAAWLASGDAVRFLAVLVVATPCPLLIAIPVAIIGSISLAAKRGIVVRNPAILEQLDGCRSIVLDKTGTLTYGKPRVTEVVPAPGADGVEALRLAASVEQYSKHPLALAVIDAARVERLVLAQASGFSEKPGVGLRGEVDGRTVEITSRGKVLKRLGEATPLPPAASGLEAVVLVDGAYAATLRFRDEPRGDSRSFIEHLGRKHALDRVLLVSGDRESEVRYLAERVGITEVRAEQSPEDKVAIVRAETARGPTLFLGDGINDAPALAVATVGVAFGQNSDVTTEAADAVVMDTSLQRVDELFHVGKRLRAIALQSAVGGMALSAVGMVIAAFGHLPPVAGAITQEVIDLVVILNALRAAFAPARLHDY
jgi:heavy metal translocating P-type ATPase